MVSVIFSLNSLKVEVLAGSDLQHLDNDDQGGTALGVWGDENFVYLANWTNGLEVYSVDQNGQLTHVDNDNQGGYARGVSGYGNFIYLANYSRGLEVYSQNGLPDNMSQMSLNVNSGGFYVNSPETSNFGNITIAQSQTSTVANITDITVEDLRGSLVGWNLNLSIDNLSLVDQNNNPIPEVDKNILLGDTVDTSVDGTYQGNQLITITASNLTTVSGRDHTNSLNLEVNPTLDTLSSLDNTGQTGNILLLNAPTEKGAGKYTFELALDILIPAYGDYNLQGQTQGLTKTVKGGTYQGQLTFDLV